MPQLAKQTIDRYALGSNPAPEAFASWGPVVDAAVLIIRALLAIAAMLETRLGTTTAAKGHCRSPVWPWRQMRSRPSPATRTWKQQGRLKVLISQCRSGPSPKAEGSPPTRHLIAHHTLRRCRPCWCWKAEAAIWEGSSGPSLSCRAIWGIRTPQEAAVCCCADGRWLRRQWLTPLQRLKDCAA